jgi:hypothetical protein
LSARRISDQEHQGVLEEVVVESAEKLGPEKRTEASRTK